MGLSMDRVHTYMSNAEDKILKQLGQNITKKDRRELDDMLLIRTFQEIAKFCGLKVRRFFSSKIIFISREFIPSIPN